MTNVRAGNVIDHLQGALHRLERSVAAGLSRSAEEVEFVAKQTTAYRDQTGATRASTNAYGFSPSDDGSRVVEDATGRGGELNPGRTIMDNFTPEHEYGVVLTAMMDYNRQLETWNGGEKSFIGPTMSRMYTVIMDKVRKAVSESLEGKI